MPTLISLLRLRRFQVFLVGLACAAVGGGVVASNQPAAAHRTIVADHASLAVRPSPPHRPNIVFVLTDDLSMNLLPYMPRVRAMERQGLTFQNYFVSDSLCCPSRSSIFTGNLPHDTHVFDNFGRQGGFGAFYRRGEENHTFAVALQRAGYLTAMMGKYLNGYMGDTSPTPDGNSAGVLDSYVPPGWSEWDVAGWGYPEFNYLLNHNGSLEYHADQPSDYLTDVIAGRGTQFIHRAAGTGRPFFLELSTFAPHRPSTPAPRDAAEFPGLQAPRPPAFDRLPVNAPRWLAGHTPLTSDDIQQIDGVFRKRAQSVQAVDDLIGRVERTLSANHALRNTYIVFSSDNGLHTGEYRLLPGKLTAFDPDIHVPLVVIGPGVRRGAHSRAITENIDLAKTFTAIGGTTLAGDGQSLLPLFQGQPATGWRDAALVEHHGSDMSGGDPDYQQTPSGNPRTYEAMRTHNFLYVEYNDGEKEFYDLRRDPFELDNVAPDLTPAQRRQLHAELQALKRCHRGPTCWSAAHLRPLPPPWPARP